MQLSYKQLQQELTDKKSCEKKLRSRINTLRKELLDHTQKEKLLIYQYERVIKDWKRKYGELINNGWKLLFVKATTTLKISRKVN